MTPHPAPIHQHGIASWYRATGHRTASGARYDPAALTCAHRTLPLGTTVRVTSHDAQGHAWSVNCVITDRGPYVPGRLLDTTRAVMDRLGDKRADLRRVEIEEVAEAPMVERKR